jgi:aspartyl protease family protein
MAGAWSRQQGLPTEGSGVFRLFTARQHKRRQAWGDRSPRPGDLWSGEGAAFRAWLHSSPDSSMKSKDGGRRGTTLRHALCWVGVFIIVIVGYTYRNEVVAVTNRVMDELVPGRQVSAGVGEAIAVRRSDGHFSFDAEVNGVRMPMMFDTGASRVTLRAEDAARCGVPVERLEFSVRVSTANGYELAAPITIDRITIGNITQRQVQGFVVKPGKLSENLLGQSFLMRLARYNVENNRLVLIGN